MDWDGWDPGFDKLSQAPLVPTSLGAQPYNTYVRIGQTDQSNWGQVDHTLEVLGRFSNGHGSKPMVPFWDRCTTHFSLF